MKREIPPTQPVASPTLTVTDNVIVYGGIRSLDDLTARVTAIANEVHPVPGLAALMSGAIAKALGVSGTEWLDGSKPVVFAVSDPKAGGMPFALVLPIKSREAFEGALPMAREAGADGATLKYRQGELDTWATYSGESKVVITQDAQAAGRLKAFIDGNLVSYAPESTVELTFPVGNLTRLYATELASVRAELSRRIADNAKGSPLEATAGEVSKELEWLFDVLPQLDSASFAIHIDGDHVMMPLTVHAKAGTAADALIGETRGRSLSLLEYVPASPYVVLGANLDPGKVGKWTELGYSLLAGALKLSAEDEAALRSLVQRTTALQTGETVIALDKDGAAAFSVLALCGTTDGAKLREAILALYSMLWTKTVDLVKATKGEPKLPLDLSTFRRAVETINIASTPLGVTLALSSETRGAATVDALTIGVDYAKIPLTTKKPKSSTILKELFGEKIVLAFGCGKERCALALGPDGVARVADALGGKKPDTSEALKAALKDAVPGASLFVYVSAIEGLKAFAAIPDLATRAERIAAMDARNGMALSIGSVSGGGLQTVLDIPVSHVKQLMTLKEGERRAFESRAPRDGRSVAERMRRRSRWAHEPAHLAPVNPPARCDPRGSAAD